eukprot:COSAG06_NODE_8453_length_2170_cov_2.412844_4_plen_93_part_00
MISFSIKWHRKRRGFLPVNLGDHRLRQIVVDKTLHLVLLKLPFRVTAEHTVMMLLSIVFSNLDEPIVFSGAGLGRFKQSVCHVGATFCAIFI